ncbi:glycosyltransferase [Candidatus Woesearchaeota archaeon]|nr:glycosyltransferase [Candidatus Woesearchaeota archaeon]
MKDLSIVIPTLNEEENVKVLINILNRLYKEAEILVVDSGSKDKTKDIALKLNAKVVEAGNGLCRAVLEGIKEAKNNFIVVMDADLQHPPELVKEIYENLKHNDIVVGTRFNREDYGNLSFIRYFISKTANFTARKFLNIKINDPMSGFFGVKKDLAKKINEERCVKEGYKVLFDILKQFSDIKIKEVRYKFQIRKEGKSKLGLKHLIFLIKSFIK